jgi:nicotinamidase-related amidase
MPPALPLPALEIPALVLVDLQNAIDEPVWRKLGERNNLSAEQNIGNLLGAWRKRRWPVYHIRHDSLEPFSPYRPNQPGNEFQLFAKPEAGETVIAKQTNSAFIGTNLESALRSAGQETLVVCGVITNNSVEATVRMAGNLGFKTYLAADGCYTFARLDWNGRLWSADEVHALSLANLHGEYCTVVQTNEILQFFSREMEI